MARPTKLDDITAMRLVQAVEKGLPRDTAAKLARIAPSTFFDWLARGRAGEAGYAEFADRIKAAEAQGEEELVGLLRNHARTTWQAAAWLLERRMPQKYALRKPEPRADEVSPEEANRLIAEAAELHKAGGMK